MADNTSQGPRGLHVLRSSRGSETSGMPVRLVRGDPSPEELAALVAVLAATVDEGDGSSALTARAASLWSSPKRMVRRAHQHGLDGWRASAFPR